MLLCSCLLGMQFKLCQDDAGICSFILDLAIVWLLCMVLTAFFRVVFPGESNACRAGFPLRGAFLLLQMFVVVLLVLTRVTLIVQVSYVRSSHEGFASACSRSYIRGPKNVCEP